MHYIFDLGNVLFQFDPSHITSKFIHSGAADQKLVASLVFDANRWFRLDDGSLTETALFKDIEDQLPEHLKAPAKELLDRWFYCLPEIPGMRSKVKALKAAGHTLHVLSNTSIALTKRYEEVPEIASFLALFDTLTFSCLERILKPNPEIFTRLLDRYHLSPEDCIFIDDSPANIESASKLHIRGILFTPDSNLDF